METIGNTCWGSRAGFGCCRDFLLHGNVSAASAADDHASSALGSSSSARGRAGNGGPRACGSRSSACSGTGARQRRLFEGSCHAQ